MTFPQPAIVRPPDRGRGHKPPIYSRAALGTWVVKDGPSVHSTDPAKLERLVSITEPMSLTQIATVLDVHYQSVLNARRASLERMAAGTAGSDEVPAPVTGDHDYAAEYAPQRFARF